MNNKAKMLIDVARETIDTLDNMDLPRFVRNTIETTDLELLQLIFGGLKKREDVIECEIEVYGRYMVREAVAGNEITRCLTMEEAEAEIKRMEEEDKEEGTYTEGFYEIVDLKNY